MPAVTVATLFSRYGFSLRPVWPDFFPTTGGLKWDRPDRSLVSCTLIISMSVQASQLIKKLAILERYGYSWWLSETMEAIEHERFVELYCEGQRYLTSAAGWYEKENSRPCDQVWWYERIWFHRGPSDRIKPFCPCVHLWKTVNGMIRCIFIIRYRRAQYSWD